MTLDRSMALLAVLVFVTNLPAAMAPTNPYHEVKDWAKLPDGERWGHVFGVGVDSHNNVWVLDRCGESSCVNSNADPIREFDSSGKFIKSIGAGLFVFPHSLLVDRDDNIWVTDCGVKDGRGNQVLKLDPSGKVLLALGKKGVLGGSPDNFVGPTDVAISANGDIFVADGHAALKLGGGEFYGFADESQSGSRMRILRFDKNGKFILAWGKEGAGPGEFNVPHGIAIDSTGRVFVADRGNNRIQIFDQQGKFLAEWKQFGKPCGLFIDRNDILYVADSDSVSGLWDYKYSVDHPCASCVSRVHRYTDVGSENPDFTQGVRIGSARDGVVTAYIPPNMGPDGPVDLTERVAVDAQGDVYMAQAQDLTIEEICQKPFLVLNLYAWLKLTSKAGDRCDWAKLYSRSAALFGFALMALAIEAQVKVPPPQVDHAKRVPGVIVPGDIGVSISEWDLPSERANPQGLFFSSSENTVWCAERATDKIDRFDPKTQKFETFQLRPGSHPNALIAHSGSGVQSTVYFTSQDGGFIGEFDPNTRDVREFRLHGGTARLNHLVFDPNGMMWFTMASANPPQFPQGAKVGSVSQFSTESRLTKALTPGVNPYDLAVDSKGTVFFTELGKPVLGVVDPVTMNEKEIPFSDLRIGIEGITITRDDVIWYTDKTRGYLGRFDPRSGDRKEWPSPSGSHSHPAQITHAGNAILYVEAGTEPNMLVRFDPQTEKSQSWALPGTDIGYIYAEAGGTVWFSRPEANRIGRMQVNGGKVNGPHK